MSSEDKLTPSNSRSNKFTGSPVAPAQAPSVSPGQAALSSQALYIKDVIIRAILDQAVVGFVQSDLAGRIIFANDRYCEITGYSREELLGKRWLDITHPDDRQNNVDYLVRMKRDEKPCSFEKRYVRKNGEIIWVNIGASQQRDAGRQELGGAAFVVDISKSKQTLDDLRSGEEKYRLLFENSRDALMTAAAPSWKFTSANRSTLEMFGAASEAEFTRLRPWDVSPELQPGGRPSAEMALQMIETAMREGSNFFEWTHMRLDGRPFPAEVLITRMEQNGQVSVQATVRDITERKQLEMELLRSEENLNLAQTVGQIGSWVLDIPTSRLEWSAETYRMFGIPPQQTVDLAIFVEVIHPDDRDYVMNAWSEAVASNTPYNIEHRIVAGGQTRWVRERAHIDRDSGGQPLTGIGTVQDITEQKILEKKILEQQKEMEKLQILQIAAQTAAAIAHELNQPLMAIASYSETALMLLRAKKPDLDKARKAIKGSERQAHRAGQSIRGMLESLSMKEFPTEVFDLNMEIVAVLDAARLEYELQFHSVLKLEKALPKVRANRTHIQKVLLNLLHNSIEAMQEAGVPPHSITVTISTIKEESLVQMTIQDNGTGFKKEDIQHLFDPFFTTKPHGIGMGLAISRSLIEANGGQLWVDPQDDPGATFHLTLPIAT